MFFTATDSFGSLHRVHLDGSNHTIIESFKIFYPTNLKLDLANEHIYWIDKYMNYVERVDYYGKNRWSMKSVGVSMQQMHSIAIFESQVFVVKSSHEKHDLWRINRRDTSSAKAIFRSDKRPIDIRIFHRQMQPNAKNPCFNQSCDHFCVPSHRSDIGLNAKCICAAGYQLKQKKHCSLVKQTSFLIYAKQSPAMIRGISISNLSGMAQESMVPVLNVKWPLSLDYNVRNQLLYFAQNDM